MNRIFSGFIVFVSVLASNQVVRSQDYSSFTQFFVNPALINPSFTGIDGQPAAFLAYKRQWIGMKGTPSIGSFSIQAPLPSKVSVGFNVGNDTRGLLSSSSLGLGLSYYATLANEMFLRFGFSVGASWTKVDIESLTFGTTSDAIMADLLKSNIQLLGSAGLSFHNKTFQIGAAIPTIFQPAYLTTDAFTVSEVKPFESLVLHSSYRFYFSRDQHSFEPFLIYRLNSSTPSQFEAAGVMRLKNMVWFGGAYRQNFGISGLLGFKLNKLIGLGYSYTLKNTGINELSRPSHEIQLAMLFGSHEKKTPIYSFVNAEKEKRTLTTAERLALAKKNGPKPSPLAKGKKPPTKTNPTNSVSRPRNNTTSITLENNTTNPVTNNQTTTNPTRNNQTTTNPVTNNQTTTNPTRNNQTTTNPVTNNQTTTNPTRNNQTTTNPVTNNQTTTNPVTNNQTTTNPVTNNQTTTNPVTNNQTTTNPVTNNQTTTNPVTNNQTTTNPVTNNQTTTNPVTNNQTTTNPVTNNQTTTNPVTNNQTTNPVTNNQTTTNPVTDNQTTTNPVTNNQTTSTETEGAIIHRPERFESATDSLQHSEELDKLKRLTEHAENPTEEHNEDGHPHAERHEFYARGNHASELDYGTHIIVGAFRSEVNAKHMADELKKLGFSDIDYGYLSEKSVWYIHFAGFEDIEAARTTRNKYRKMKMFKDAWLLTVHQ